VTNPRAASLSLPLAVAFLAAACGYHVGGKGELIPKDVKTIAIPAFGNASVRYQIAQLLPAAIAREFHSRTHYTIVTDPNQADAVLRGTVSKLEEVGITSDIITGRMTGGELIVTLQLNLFDRHTGKTLFSRTGFEFRERYEVSTDPKAYFDESGTAMKRLSQDVARSVVTAILEAF